MERFSFLIAVGAIVAVSIAGVLPTGPVVVAGFAAAIAVFGLPHGALDARVAANVLGARGLRGTAAFVVAYVAVAALVAGIWWLAPTAALVAFLLYAAFHFGEDWSDGPVAALAAGGSIVALPAVRFEAEVAAIFSALSAEGAPVAAALHHVAPVLALLAVILLHRRPGALVELGAYAAIALAAPPLVAFGAYFLALHSPRHVRQTCESLGCAPREALASVAPYAVAAALGGAAVAAIFVAAGGAATDAAYRVVFIGLAALTVPHMMLESIADRPALAAAVRRRLGVRERCPPRLGSVRR